MSNMSDNMMGERLGWVSWYQLLSVIFSRDEIMAC